jgi:hypothetical protein
MPTGYTADVASGKVQTLKEYALLCARAFGSCITMRDDPLSSEIPEEFEVCNYHKDAIIKEEAELKAFLEKSDDELFEDFKQENQENIEYHQKEIEENRLIIERYKKMLEKVSSFKPLTEDHQNFVKFMKNQLEDSMRYDDNSEYHCKQLKEAIELKQKIDSNDKKAFLEWKEESKKSLMESVAYHKKNHDKEVESVRKRNEWLRNLRIALEN